MMNLQENIQRIKKMMGIISENVNIKDLLNSTEQITLNLQILDEARNLIGKPYCWGGESMNEGGYDCSGFVSVVTKLNRQTAQGYWTDKKLFKIERNETMPGDLVFYGSQKASHIGVIEQINPIIIINASGNQKCPCNHSITKPNGRETCVVRRDKVDFMTNILGFKRFLSLDILNKIMELEKTKSGKI